MRGKQFVIFGLGRFGISLATTLSEAGYEVMVVDKCEESIQEIAPFVTHAVQADAADMDTLKSLGIRNFDVAIVAIGKDIQSSIMTTLLLKELGIPYVVAKASSEIHERVLRKIGADRIILPEQEMGIRIANNLDHIQLSSEYSIIEMGILPEWRGKSIIELDPRGVYGINIIAVQRGGVIDISPSPNYILEQEDTLVVVGSNKQIQILEAKRYGK